MIRKLLNKLKSIFIKDKKFVEYSRGVHSTEYIFDNILGICYNINRNKFENWTNKHLKILVKKITKQEFEGLLKNKHCNCEVGSGHNIVISHNYNVKKEINDKYKNYYIEYNEEQDSLNGTRYRLYEFAKWHSIVKYFTLGRYERKACLNCKTPLDEINKLYSDFEEIINEVEQDKLNKKMVDDICKKG